MSDRLVHRLREVQNEYLIIRAALRHAQRTWSQHERSPDWEGRTIHQVRLALDRLEATFIIRLFSEFEGILREYWGKDGRDPEEHRVGYLIDQIGLSQMDAKHRERVHEVQRCRNDLAHGSASRAVVVPFDEALKRLAKYLDRLPDR